jgi:hypothetical protein
MSMNDPATKQDLKDAITELKLYVEKNENSWLRWLVGIQLTYFAITLAAVFFITEHIK